MKKSVSIIGGGPAALILAALLDCNKFKVTVYEKNKTLGRKFLVAGKGGFNLTHSEPIGELIARYTPPHFLEKALLDFDNEDFRHWIDSIGIPTYIGSSKRVYPESGIKPITVLNAILNVLNKQGVAIEYQHTWKGWTNEKDIVFNTDTTIKSDYTIFAMGGGSWKVTGSDGSWLDLFEMQSIPVVPFQSSNCAYRVNWPEDFILEHEGSPLKNIAISCLNKKQKGEAVITRFGLEGNAIYALSPQIREELESQQKATVFLDMKPTLLYDDLLQKIKKSTFKKTSETLQKEVKLSSAQIGLLKKYLSKETYLNPELLAQNIKKLPIEITDTSLLNDAISTTGGIQLSAVDENFQLKNKKSNYCIGEMLDWDAPTGGYLLQACFSMGMHLARHLNKVS
ncbi:BaiN/RdsA family NAD(P)/FAD-dependent oxidoreductase [Flavobacterium psychrolimnae]|uniref:Aminoacetone oxidase family FAD-binding enzyme n=1 Tax=Flavobacterium psychrolimnae TaxID=249351 RepID=A0A366AZD6_9FLAO|nr:TIGR03862 family flavoprotein [Flavobacterium psychrolimnae]RBN50096.1 aminoacetone oxidase family FAD-binding enzyme [Flavobacterium psychrolimnae]